MVSDLVDELLTAIEKDKSVLSLRGGIGSTSLKRDALSVSEIEAAAGVKVLDEAFLEKLTLKNKDIPDVLKGNYDPEAAFKLAFESMGTNLRASINSVLQVIRVETSKIPSTLPAVPVLGWRTRKSDSVAAFEEIITAVEMANVDTNSAYITFKGRLQAIGQQIAPLEGLPSNITPQISAMHQLVVQFQSNAEDLDFKKLFTLKPRKPSDATVMPREPGSVGFAGSTISPLTLMRPLKSGLNYTVDLRTHQYTLWMTVLDCYNLAVEAIIFYKKIGFDLQTTTGGTPGRWNFITQWRRPVSPVITTTAFASLIRTRDTMRDELVAALDDPPSGISIPNVDGHGTKITPATISRIMRPAPPAGVSTIDEMEEQLKYTQGFLGPMEEFIESTK